VETLQLPAKTTPHSVT